MAEVMEGTKIPSNGKVNAALTTGIIGTSLSGLMALGGAGIGKNLDNDYCWYYWSENPDDSLEYEDFLIEKELKVYHKLYNDNFGKIKTKKR